MGKPNVDGGATGRAPLALVLALTATMVLITGWSTLYHGVQHTYLLHALAQSGYGNLASDWQATTQDPMPVATAAVALGYRAFGPVVFWVLHLATLFVAFGSLLWWSARRLTPLQLVALAGLLALLVFDLTGHLSESRLGQGRIAGHSAFGSTFSPASFGLLLLLALVLFAEDRPTWAAAVAAVAALFHPAYLTAGGLLVAGAVVSRGVTWPSIRSVWPFAVGAVPVALRATTMSGSAGTEVLVTWRIPHHAIPSVWFGWDDVIWIGVVVAAVWVYRHDLLGRVVGWTAALALSASVVAVAFQWYELMLAMPWRIFVLLVPLASVMLCVAAIRSVAPIMVVPAGALALVVAAAVGIDMTPVGPPARVDVPAGTYLTPLDWDSFRLAAGQPVFVDWKSHPFASDEVIAWQDRVQQAQRFWEGDCDALPDEVDWVVGDDPPPCDALDAPTVVDETTVWRVDN